MRNNKADGNEGERIGFKYTRFNCLETDSNDKFKRNNNETEQEEIYLLDE